MDDALTPDVTVSDPHVITRTLNSGPITKVLIWVAGVDLETLRRCPAGDWDNVRAIAFLLLGVLIYQSTVLSLVAHRVLASDSAIHPEFVLGAVFVGLLIMCVDSYCFVRAGFYADGVRQLARAGLDIGGGVGAKIAAALFLALRILLSLGFALLTGICVGLIFLRFDIGAQTEQRFMQENAPLIGAASERVDAGINRAGEAQKAAESRVAALEAQVTAMRNGTINPAATDSAIASQQEEIRQLLAEKAQRDAELAAAETFARDELAGMKGSPSNTGVPGRGPVREAAEERVRTATANVDATDHALAAARSRLDTRHQQVSRGAEAALPNIERDLQAATTELANARNNLANLVKGRNDAIRNEIEQSPQHVDRDEGFLAQVRALRQLAEDPTVAAMILLLDFVSFGIELAAVLAKVTTLLPSTYAALVASDVYMRVIEIVDGMEKVLNRRDRGEGETAAPHGDAPKDGSSAVDMTWFSGAPTEEAKPAPGKRPRGRPRKEGLNSGSPPKSPPAAGEDKGDPEKDDEGQ